MPIPMFERPKAVVLSIGILAKVSAARAARDQLVKQGVDLLAAAGMPVDELRYHIDRNGIETKCELIVLGSVERTVEFPPMFTGAPELGYP